VRMSKGVGWVLVGCSLALVLWIRLVPQALPVTDSLAHRLIIRQLRQRAARGVRRHFPREQWQEQIDHHVARWINRHKARFEATKATISQRLKSRLSYEGKDGRVYPYVGDADSYLWLRNARNYLRTGTTCDAVVAGECRDTYGLAPVGYRMRYQRSLHIAAIVGLHWLITRFDPDYPLPASTLLVPVIVGALGVLPAFCIGRYLAGNLGGLFAGLLTALNPMLLIRSTSSDNDIWHVVLPLYMLWAATAALHARRRRAQSVYAALAGVCAGLHAITWRGWLFFYAMLLAGLLGSLGVHGIRHAFLHRTVRVWLAAGLRRALLVTGVFVVMAGVCTTLAGTEESYLTIPAKLFRAVVGQDRQENAGRTTDEIAWPDALQTVKELRRADMATVVTVMGGTYVFPGALLGLVILLLPDSRWHWWHFAVLLGAAALYTLYILGGDTMGRNGALALLALPLAGALLVYLCDPTAHRDTDIGLALTIIAWFLGALFLSYSGNRYLLLLGPPCGLAFTAAAGRLRTWLGMLASRIRLRPPIVATVLPSALTALLLILPMWQGYVMAGSYKPAINDAWWGALTHLRDASPPNAIVNAWWDYGYWIKYVAERRVSSDGGSLLTHVHHWIAKALMAPSERQSVGVLRMLNCGSDATPWPEGKRGAYGKLVAAGRDPVTAYTIVSHIVGLEAADARAYLAARGFPATAQTNILRSTHCTPPEAYLITTTQQLYNPHAWTPIGLWDPRRAYLASRVERLPKPDLLSVLVKRFGYTEPAAAALYEQARALKSPQQTENFVMPQHERYYGLQWYHCHPAENRPAMVCPVDLRLPRRRSILKAFVYDPVSPQTARLRLRPAASERTESVTEEAPAVVMLAGAQHLVEKHFPASHHPDIGVLVDVPQQRILVGTPRLLRSTFTHLMYLDGRYASFYEKFDDRVDYSGHRIVTWKINWNGR
jgi:hypothetical protein